MSPLILTLGILGQSAVYFSPPAIGQTIGAEEIIIQEIKSAKRSVIVQAYSFTSIPITDALITKAKEGKYVEIVIDDSAIKTAATRRLLDAGIVVWIDNRHAIAHNKIIIIDNELVEETTTISGSYNFSEAASKRNAENIRVVHRDPLGAAYTANWWQHKKHSIRLH
jgi:phosphatidylserine/phosphatidylglycerophosphate/cardiolipin synthase-like enzyme